MVKRIQPGKRMSQAVIHGDTVYLAGQVAEDPSASIQNQTRSVLAKIDAILAEAGSSKSDLISVTVYLSSIADFAAMNEVYDAWIDPANPATRACLESRLASPDLRVEIVAVAAKRS
ncbi:Enamine deaminase RidA, house cleaning of reactive enamine intermediates, YjgF/YER057c/UK114 family [Arboricoccus pini]|uniref:Enamine deaminase RidA, house cleaning of reactive enamine intermediates, YjgF/YER057c/UK114 family n=1 Tax=Arboricoccus pini TaxID=1963835 RepID=A0A212R7L4_9PROT|nr:RidA family protein [Arboricoccus pini]SNB68154.1 Enamine deaminase RidA, house cleaning of reactive enamine intermediates, YjgF/YER057c/UK114 family [Arboricoccus pini]